MSTKESNANLIRIAYLVFYAIFAIAITVLAIAVSDAEAKTTNDDFFVTLSLEPTVRPYVTLIAYPMKRDGEPMLKVDVNTEYPLSAANKERIKGYVMHTRKYCANKTKAEYLSCAVISIDGAKIYLDE